jgi:hypothetical protein
MEFFKMNSNDPVTNTKVFSDWLNKVSAEIFVKKKDRSSRHCYNHEGFNHSRWYDMDCKHLNKQKLLAKKKFGRNSSEFKIARNQFSSVCRKKKYMFELAISEKLAGLRCKDPKAFWNLLKEGFGNNKVGDIEMSEWHDHFSKLFLHTNTGDESGDTQVNYDFKVDELDKKFTLQEIREAIFYQLRFHKASGPDGITNELLKWSLDWIQNILLLLFNQLWKRTFTRQAGMSCS